MVNQKLAVKILEKYGHSVEIAENGSLAVDSFKARVGENRPFDVILVRGFTSSIWEWNLTLSDLILQMDVSMPFMGGMEATELIRAHENLLGIGRVPIIALTAHASTYSSGSVRSVRILTTCSSYSDRRPRTLPAGRHGRPHYQYVPPPNFFMLLGRTDRRICRTLTPRRPPQCDPPARGRACDDAQAPAAPTRADRRLHCMTRMSVRVSPFHAPAQSWQLCCYNPFAHFCHSQLLSFWCILCPFILVPTSPLRVSVALISHLYHHNFSSCLHAVHSLP